MSFDHIVTEEDAAQFVGERVMAYKKMGIPVTTAVSQTLSWATRVMNNPSSSEEYRQASLVAKHLRSSLAERAPYLARDHHVEVYAPRHMKSSDCE